MILVDWGKTKKATRYAPLSDRVRDMLLERLKTVRNQWVFPSPRRKGRTSHFNHQQQFGELRNLVGIPGDLVLYSATPSGQTSWTAHTRSGWCRRAVGHERNTTTQRYLRPELSGLAENRSTNVTASAQKGAENPAPQNLAHIFRHTRAMVQ
jgi:integrase